MCCLIMKNITFSHVMIMNCNGYSMSQLFSFAFDPELAILIISKFECNINMENYDAFFNF